MILLGGDFALEGTKMRPCNILCHGQVGKLCKNAYLHRGVGRY